MAECSERSIRHCAPCGLTLWLWLRRKCRLDELRLLIFSAAFWQGFEKSERGPSLAFLLPPQALYNKNSTPDGVLFLLWARQDLNPRPSGYENVANFEIPFFLWNLVTIS